MPTLAYVLSCCMLVMNNFLVLQCTVNQNSAKISVRFLFDFNRRTNQLVVTMGAVHLIKKCSSKYIMLGFSISQNMMLFSRLMHLLIQFPDPRPDFLEFLEATDMDVDGLLWPLLWMRGICYFRREKLQYCLKPLPGIFK